MLIIWSTIATFLYIIDILLLVPKYTKCKYDHTKRKTKLIWKGSCIIVPVLVLLSRVVYLTIINEVKITHVLFLLGIILCAIGDIYLEIKFVKGGFFFGLGHLFYIASLMNLWYLKAGIHSITFIIPIALYVPLCVVGTILTVKLLGKFHREVLLTYNAIISASFALGFTLIIYGRGAEKFAGLGACLLVISDWILARNKIAGRTYMSTLISLLIYFSGQIMISMIGFM